MDFNRIPKQETFSTPNSLILPHTPEAGDVYYIGDVYDRITKDRGTILSLSSSSSSSGSSSPYRSYLRSLASGWPHVQYLADFMDVTTSPTKLKFLTPADKAERACRTRVSTLDFDARWEPKRTDYTTLKGLSKALKDPENGHDNVYARLFVVEDLSREVIEALGTRFDIDPLFFRGHISDYMWYHTRDPWIELNDLNIVASSRSFYHFRYAQTRYFRNGQSLKNARKQAGGFNVLRRIDSDGDNILGVEIESEVGMVRSKASLWIRPNKDHETGILGVLLVDPTISEGYPIWGGYRNFDDCPSMHAEDIPKGPPRTSLFEDVIYWTSSMNEEEIKALAIDPRIFARRTLFLICSEWLIMIKYATLRLSQIDWEVENPGYRISSKGLNTSLQKVHPWRRRIPLFQAMVSEVLDNVLALKSPSDSLITELRRDFEIVMAELAILQNRADRIVNVATAIISIDESKKATQQNQNTTRLTYLAVIFVPLSFVSSLFSMTTDITQLTKTFWIYVVVAIPLTITALLATRYSFYLYRK